MTSTSSSEGFPAFARNPAELPHPVRPKGWALVWRIVQYGFGVVLGLGVASILLLGGAARAAPASMLFALAGASGSLLCVRGLWLLRTPFAVFRDDGVERRGLYGWRRLARSDIAGVGKTLSSRNGAYFLIHPKPGAGGPISFPAYVREDPVVVRWLAGALDPQDEAIKADRAAILADPAYGATQQERAARLEMARRAMVALALAGACGGAWLGFRGPLSGEMTLLAIGAGLIGAVIVVASQGLIVWLPGAKARPSALGALGPLAGLVARAAFTVHLHDATPLMIAAAVVGVAAAGALALRPLAALGGQRAAIGVGVMAGVAAFGAAELIDVAFDRGRPDTYATVVEDKHVSHGRSTTYTLDLAAPAGRGAESVSVGSAAYDRAQTGDTVCVVDHPGAVGAPWFELADCPATAVGAS